MLIRLRAEDKARGIDRSYLAGRDRHFAKLRGESVTVLKRGPFYLNSANYNRSYSTNGRYLVANRSRAHG